MKDIAPKILQLAPTPAYSHRELVKEAEHLEMLSEWEEASARREWEVALHEAQLHCIESSWTELAEAYLSKP